METRPVFTWQQGMARQVKDLEHWRLLLKPEVYAALHGYTKRLTAEIFKLTRTTNPAYQGYEVPRGDKLRGFVINYWPPNET